ncbi:hypothetical protein ACEPAF_3127 [Sanghuangporus sanghuang]
MSWSSKVGPVQTPSRYPFHLQPIKVDLTDDQRAALPTNTRWSVSRGQYIIKSGNQTFIAWWDETAKKWYSTRGDKSQYWRAKQESDVDNPAPPTPTRSTASLPGPSTSTGQTSAPPIAPSLSFIKPREPALLVPTDKEEEDEEEEQEMSLSKESITDLAMAIVLALQVAGEGTSQGSKTNKVHVAKPQDFDGEHGYVNFK